MGKNNLRDNGRSQVHNRRWGGKKDVGGEEVQQKVKVEKRLSKMVDKQFYRNRPVGVVSTTVWCTDRIKRNNKAWRKVHASMNNLVNEIGTWRPPVEQPSISHRR